MQSQPLSSPIPTQGSRHGEKKQVVQTTQLSVGAPGNSFEIVPLISSILIHLCLPYKYILPALNGVFVHGIFIVFSDLTGFYNLDLVIFYYRHWVTIAYTWIYCPFFFTDSRYWILINDFHGPLKNAPPWIGDHVEEEKGLSEHPET